MEERIELTNHSMGDTVVQLELELGADFADVQEARKAKRRHVGRTELRTDPAHGLLVFEHRDDHENHSLHRGLRVRIATQDGAPDVEIGHAEPRGSAPEAPWTGEVACVLRTSFRLGPRASRQFTLTYESLVDGGWRSPLAEDASEGRPITSREREHEVRKAGMVSLETDEDVVATAFSVAAEDLWDLRNWDLSGDRSDSWVPNAGVPAFTGLFGRDSLIAGMLGLIFGPEPLAGALRLLAATQGTQEDPWTEEQPGRMIHEMRRGPLAELRITPHRHYYGAYTTSTLFVSALAEYWHWTGRLDVVREHLQAAQRALEWAERDADQDGDGFLDYASSSEDGLKNEAWKDSAEAIRYPDGRLVPNPVATVEEQVFHIAALERMAELVLAIGERERAAGYLDRARQLRSRWQEAYWMPEAMTYAIALDPDKRQVSTIGSNPGHGLALGVLPEGHAASIADRLMAPDMFSGWGVRTLSREHPSYNPLAYHLGAVWPFENALFVRGFRRYGLDDHAERLLEALFAAAGHFEGVRLPELFGGHGRDQLPFPTMYPDTNVPQAWTAAAIGSLVQSMLGITPFAPAGTLILVRPSLPAWLPHLTLRRLHIGDARVSIRFERQSDGRTMHEVLETHGDLHVVRTPDAPGVLTVEDLKPVLSSDRLDGLGPALKLGLLGVRDA
jgi:glycogen debranching enzyme